MGSIVGLAVAVGIIAVALFRSHFLQKPTRWKYTNVPVSPRGQLGIAIFIIPVAIVLFFRIGNYNPPDLAIWGLVAMMLIGWVIGFTAMHRDTGKTDDDDEAR
jgi:hypothetical protein